MTEKNIIEFQDGEIRVPTRPVIPFIEGDGTGPDIWAAASRVFDAAVERAYGDERRIEWLEVLAGQKAFDQFGEPLPEKTVESLREYRVGIKGPLTTPVGGGFRSLNVTLRRLLDLYVCLRPVRWFKGVDTPVKRPDRVDMVVFRENMEDVYSGYEVRAGSAEAGVLRRFLEENFDWILGEDAGIGIKPISKRGSIRLIRAAFEFALEQGRKSVTLVHKGNIQKFTEGAFLNWGRELARQEYPGRVIPWEDGEVPDGAVVLQDAIADVFFQQALTRPENFDVIATTNLNGDYISDAIAGQVGGIGMAPGGNINFETGHALFEATHGTAPKYAGLDKVNPTSVILSGEMMFRYLKWDEAADKILRGVEEAIEAGRVTYDLARLREGAEEIPCSEFGEAVISHMK
ncbi:MAG: NADP-dependent isocitrate dehydrogenase [Planctomycetota bacterium]